MLQSSKIRHIVSKKHKSTEVIVEKTKQKNRLTTEIIQF